MKFNTILLWFIVLNCLLMLSLSVSIEETRKKSKSSNFNLFAGKSVFKNNDEKLKTAKYRFKLAVKAVIALNRLKKLSNKTKTDKKIEPTKQEEQKGIFSRILSFIGNPFKSKKEEVEMLVDKSIEMKEKLKEEVFNQHSHLDWSGRYLISYYIGMQDFKTFETKKSQLTENIEKFINNRRIEDAKKKEESYKKTENFMKKILYLNDGVVYDVLSSLDKVQLDIVADYSEKFHRDFLETQLPSFDDQDVYIKEELPNTVDVQLVLDSVKKSVDFINSKAKTVLDYYEFGSMLIKENDSVMKSLKTCLDNLDKHVKDKVKKNSSRLEIISLMVKIQQGDYTATDVVKLVAEVNKVFEIPGLKEYSKGIDIAKNLLDVKDRYDKLKTLNKPQDTANALSNVMMIAANLGSLSPIPLHKAVATAMKFTANRIDKSEKIQSLINDSVETSAHSFDDSYKEDRLGFSAQFYSDFAIDYFNAPSCRFRSNTFQKESEHTNKDNYSANYRDFSNEGTLPRSAVLTDDFASDCTLNYTREGAIHSLTETFSDLLCSPQSNSQCGEIDDNEAEKWYEKSFNNFEKKKRRIK